MGSLLAVLPLRYVLCEPLLVVPVHAEAAVEVPEHVVVVDVQVDIVGCIQRKNCCCLTRPRWRSLGSRNHTTTVDTGRPFLIKREMSSSWTRTR